MTWPDPADLSSPAEVSVAHARQPGWPVEQEEQCQGDSLLLLFD